MKSSSVIFASAIAALLAGCGGSDPATTSGNVRVAQGGARSAEGATPVPQMDEPLRMDQIPDLGKAGLVRQGGRYRQGDALPGLAIDSQDREAVRLFYNGLYAGLKEPAMNWTGSYVTGTAGTVGADFQSFMLQRINWYRAMAGVPADLQLSADWNAKDQDAAMLMSVNNQLSHTPPSSWVLYSASAADGAGHSSLTLASGARAINNYIYDAGSNNGPVGHRRALLYPQTKTIGIGNVPGGVYKGVTVSPANAVWAYDENVFLARPKVRDDFVAWPPSGFVPYQLTFGRWSFSYPNADFSKATVTVTQAGVSIPVSLEPLASGFGENTIVWLLSGTNDSSIAAPVAKDTQYQVTIASVYVDGKPRTFNYNVTVFDPQVPTAGVAQSSVSAPSMPRAGASFSLQIDAMKNATGFDVLQYQRNRLGNVVYDVANAVGNWLFQTSGTYDSTAGVAFNLHHDTYVDQIMQFNKSVSLGAKPQLSFMRSTGYATAKESLKVQVSSDEGANWSDVYTEVGADAPTIASTVNVNLEKYAGRKLNLRFLVTQNGSFYSCATCGWNLSAISLQDFDELVNPKTYSVGAGVNSLSMTISTPGDYALFGRTQLQGRYYSDVGQASLLHADGAILTGPRSNYTVVKTDAGYVITDTVGKDGVQTVVNPLRLDFKDLSLAFDTAGNAGAAYRLYQAAFDRKPDLGGMGFWLKALDSGYSAVDMARGFMASAEFKALYGSAPTNEQLITGFYKNVLHRAPDAGGFDFWLKAMKNGIAAEVVLSYFADSPENKDQVAAAIANGIEYIPTK